MNNMGPYDEIRKKFNWKISEDELDLLTFTHRKDLELKEFIILQEDRGYVLDFSNHLGSCPQLNGSKCMIHKNPKRPSTCDNFPIFIDEEKKEIRLSPRCFAVKENKLYPYIHKFLELGFKVHKI